MAVIAMVADDLSGAVETAATFLSRTSRIDVVLDTAGYSPSDRVDVLAIDTNSRHLSAPAASVSAGAAFTVAHANSSLIFKKIDSLLRGNIQAELLAAQQVRRQLVVAPALPSAGRVVRNGVLHVDGEPLHQSDAWRAEASEPPENITASLPAFSTEVLPLAVVRSGDLPARLRETLGRDAIPVCDAETDEDLDRLVAATAGIDELVLVGSAGLAAAIARSLPGNLDAGSRPAPAARVLVCIGSAATVVAEQLSALREVDVDVILVQPTDLDDGGQERARIETAIRNSSGATVVVAVDPAAAVDPTRSRALAQDLSAAVASTADGFDGLVLTGGETARAVLDQLGVTQLCPQFQVHHGAVVSTAPDGRLIATRPGSFGDRQSLTSIVRALRNGAPLHEESP